MNQIVCQHVFGPLPSRRLGKSVGISPIPPKTCNYSCTYCQLGRTTHLVNERKDWYPLEEILEEVDAFLAEGLDYDVLSIVGEGEPTLYRPLGALIDALKKRQDKPVAVITNAANLDDPEVFKGLRKADIVLPSLDCVDPKIWRSMHRPARSVNLESILDALVQFSKDYRGQLWLEIMLLGDVNAGKEQIDALVPWVEKIAPDRVYINTPVRPPAEADVHVASAEELQYAAEKLQGIIIDQLTAGLFYSADEDDVSAILALLRRHPMNEFEVCSFCRERRREEDEIEAVLQRLEQNADLEVITYKGIRTWRYRARAASK